MLKKQKNPYTYLLHEDCRRRRSLGYGYPGILPYLINNKKNQSLAEFLDDQVFAGDTGTSVAPTPEDVAGFNAYIENYKQCLPIEEAAVKFKK